MPITDTAPAKLMLCKLTRHNGVVLRPIKRIAGAPLFVLELGKRTARGSYDRYYREDTLQNATDYPDELKAYNDLRETIKEASK